jgi:PST family polysaccharide transporter
VGVYSAAFALSGIFVNFVLNAMSADYYPRLASLIGDSQKTVEAVREQSEIALLLALPGLAVTIYAAPWIVELLYSSEFAPAANLIKIFILGCFGRVVAWPLGYVVLAAGKAWLFLALESGLAGLQFLLTVVYLPAYGLDAVAWAFAFVALINILVESVVAKNLIGYSWSLKKIFMVLISGLVMVCLYFNASFAASWTRYAFGLLIVLAAFFVCSWALLLLMKNPGSSPIKILK